MPKSAEPEPRTPTDAGDSSRFNPTHPRLVPDDEDDLAEGETVLTFLAPPPPDSGE
jgi:hypothetical protein